MTELNNPLYILAVALQVLGQEDAFVEAFLAAARAEVLQAVGPSAEELHPVEGVRLAVELQVDVDLKIIVKKGIDQVYSCWNRYKCHKKRLAHCNFLNL